VLLAYIQLIFIIAMFRATSHLKPALALESVIPSANVTSILSTKPRTEFERNLKHAVARVRIKMALKPTTIQTLIASSKTVDDFQRTVEFIPALRKMQFDTKSITSMLLDRSLNFKRRDIALNVLSDPLTYGLAPTTKDLNKLMSKRVRLPLPSQPNLPSKRQVKVSEEAFKEVMTLAGLFSVYKLKLNADSYATLIQTCLNSEVQGANDMAMKLAKEARNWDIKLDCKTLELLVPLEQSSQG
jgi:hypothetical protein